MFVIVFVLFLVLLVDILEQRILDIFNIALTVRLKLMFDDNGINF